MRKADKSSRRWRALVFPCAIWLAGSFFLLGKLGKWSDDYSMMCANKATLEWTFAGVSKYMWDGMWRPINLQTAGYLQSVLWTQDRVIHTITALLHAMVAWMLWKFLRKAGISARAAAGGAVLFLAAPMGYEVICWAATIGAAIGAIVALGLGMLVIALGRGGVRWRVFACVGLALALVIACAYEQPATACAAMPLLYLGASDAKRGWRRRLTGAGGVALVLGLGCLAYVAAVMATVHAGSRGSAQAFVNRETIGAQAMGVLHGLPRRLLLERFAAGAWDEGVWRVMQTPAWTGVVALLLGLGGVMWVRWWMRAGQDGVIGPEPSRGVGRWWLAGFGAAGFLLAFVPILAVRGQGVESRLVYWPLACAAIILATGADDVIARSGRWKAGWAVRGAMGAAAAAAAVAGCVVLIGVQSAFAKRSRMDHRTIADIRARLPDPAPGTVFVAMTHKDRAVHTGSAYFDTFTWGVWQIPWAALPAVQLGYRREDLFAISNAPWTNGMDVDGVSERGLLTRPGRWAWGKSPDAQGRQVIGWERIAPVRVNAQGRADVASAVVLELPDGRDVVQRLPQADRLVNADAKGLRVRMGCDVAPGMKGIEAVSGWRWVTDTGLGGAVEMTRQWCWEVTHRAVRMTPARGKATPPGSAAAWGERSRMAMEAAGSTAEVRRVLHLRLTSVPGVLKTKGVPAAPDATMLEICVDGSAEPVMRVEVDARGLERERRWMDVACVLPRTANGKTRVEVRVRRIEGKWPADVWVSAGAVVEEESEERKAKSEEE